MSQLNLGIKMTGFQKANLKALCIKVKNGVYIDLYLKEGISEKTSHATYITLSIYKDGNKIPIHLTKPKACQLSVMLNQLVEEGNNEDYKKLRQKYPDQDSWHIY
jgi:hypothetical protein